MAMPGFSAEAALATTQSFHRGRQGPVAARSGAVAPQGETCDYGYIGDGTSLYIVCCDPDRRPPCLAYGLV